jgi:hypothetical protein
MIELLVVLMLVVVGGGAYLYALVLASSPLTPADLAGLKQCHADLTERIEKGREQNWDAVMLCHLRQQRAELEERIAKAAPLHPG